MALESREYLSLAAEAPVMLGHATSCCSNDIAGDNSARQNQA